MEEFLLRRVSIVLSILIFLSISLLTYSQTKAFPTAEGYGRFTVGGRGGDVYLVTNLNDKGAGSLRTAVEAQGARTVVFRVSGTIHLDSELKVSHDSITIAGQTAPGEGICVAGYNFRVSADNVIIRYMHFRLGDLEGQEDDAIWGREQQNIILDHCTMSWSVDECASFYDNKDFTMQWCLLSESLNSSVHGKGEHGYGGIWGGMGATFHHNLLAHHKSRNPRFNGSRYSGDQDSEIVDFVNNVIYNWGENSSYGGEAGNQNIRANYYKYGPGTERNVRDRIVQPYDNDGNWYIADNYVYGYPEVTEDNWNGGVQGGYADSLKNKNITEPFPIAEVSTQTAEEAYELVLAHAGVTFPARDTLDQRIIREVRTGTATYGGVFGSGSGIIDTQEDVGGWPVLNSVTPPLDTDSDGMPDEWEYEHGLDSEDPVDGNELNDEGYTMLEVYLNSIVDDNVTGVEEDTELAHEFELHQNYPNPFNPSTTIRFTIPAGSNKSLRATLVVFNILGQKVATLMDEYKNAGTYEVNFNASRLSSGVYFYSLSYGNMLQTKKMILLK